MKIGEFFYSRAEKDLFSKNREAVDKFLFYVTRVATVILEILMGVMIFVANSFDYTSEYKKIYLIIFILDALFLFSLFIFKRFLSKHPIVCVYLFFTLYFCFSIVANYSNDKVQEYVSVVVALFMIPLLILDRTWRVNLFVGAALACSLFFSHRLKSDDFFRADIINLILYTFAGLVMGKSMRLNRLRGFDAERTLTMERNTDSLTNLPNRRKLFEHLRMGINSLLTRPTGMFMIDIDHFKLYNDNFGHRSGDICLGVIGHCFADFGEKNQIKFFRYGGEEFCALCWSKNYEQLGDAAEKLLQEVRELSIDFKVPENESGIVTISLGFAAFDQTAMEYDFERMIKVADGALYKAKEEGRNRACGA